MNNYEAKNNILNLLHIAIIILIIILIIVKDFIEN